MPGDRQEPTGRPNEASLCSLSNPFTSCFCSPRFLGGTGYSAVRSVGLVPRSGLSFSSLLELARRKEASLTPTNQGDHYSRCALDKKDNSHIPPCQRMGGRTSCSSNGSIHTLSLSLYLPPQRRPFRCVVDTIQPLETHRG